MERRRNELLPELEEVWLRRFWRNAIAIEFTGFCGEQIVPHRYRFIGLIAIIFGHCPLPHGAGRRLVKLLRR
jgi:hypothetical protein